MFFSVVKTHRSCLHKGIWVLIRLARSNSQCSVLQLLLFSWHLSCKIAIVIWLRFIFDWRHRQIPSFILLVNGVKFLSYLTWISIRHEQIVYLFGCMFWIQIVRIARVVVRCCVASFIYIWTSSVRKILSSRMLEGTRIFMPILPET